MSGHAGSEWKPTEKMSIRAGYKTDTLRGLNALAGLTCGFGLTLWGQELAYAWTPYGELGSAQYLSFQFRFRGRKEPTPHLMAAKSEGDLSWLR